MKNVSKDFSTFEKFKLKNLKIIVGGTDGGGGPIDPPFPVPVPTGNDRP